LSLTSIKNTETAKTVLGAIAIPLVTKARVVSALEDVDYCLNCPATACENH